MANINSVEAYQELLSLTLEDRSSDYADLVSNSNVLTHELKKRGNYTTFSGPAIRETLLFGESGTYVRYSGYDTLNPLPADLFNDAVFVPKMAAVAVSMSMETILKNSGPNQLKDVFKAHISAAETELEDRFCEDLHSAGTEANQIGGLQMAIPTTPTNSYGGIDRNAYTIWRTTTYDAHTYFTGHTGVTASNVKGMFNQVMIERSKGRKGPNLILASQEHFLAYSAATETIQRVTDNTSNSALGFTSLKFFGAGKSVDIVLEGGQGSAMPSNTTYFLDTSSIRFRHHPERNFKPFGGKRAPIDQDAVVQYIGFMGNLTLNNPRHNAKFYDSTP